MTNSVNSRVVCDIPTFWNRGLRDEVFRGETGEVGTSACPTPWASNRPAVGSSFDTEFNTYDSGFETEGKEGPRVSTRILKE